MGTVGYAVLPLFVDAVASGLQQPANQNVKDYVVNTGGFQLHTVGPDRRAGGAAGRAMMRRHADRKVVGEMTISPLILDLCTKSPLSAFCASVGDDYKVPVGTSPSASPVSTHLIHCIGCLRQAGLKQPTDGCGINHGRSVLGQWGVSGWAMRCGCGCRAQRRAEGLGG